MGSNVPVFVPLTRPAPDGKVKDMPLAPRSLAAAAALLILVSCGERPGYQNHVRLLPDAQAHPLLQEVLPLFNKPPGRNPDDLIRVWKEFLGETPIPLRKDSVVTFVYYDFSGTRNQVWLEASFAPSRREPMTKVPSVGLFYKVYDIPNMDGLKYRFTDGNAPLHDPFNAQVEIGSESWHTASDPAKASERWLTGAADSALGHDLRIVLPPSYERELAQSYPLVVIQGLDGWAEATAQLLDSGAALPFIAVPALDDATQTWLQNHFRLAPNPPFQWKGTDPNTMVAALKAQFPVDNP
jgi:hypothetical protein